MHTPPFFTEEQLISSLKKRERAALEYFYDLYAPQIFGLIFKIVGDHKAAEIVFVNTFLEFWKDIPQFDERTTIFRWTLDIARKNASTQYHLNKE